MGDKNPLHMGLLTRDLGGSFRPQLVKYYHCSLGKTIFREFHSVVNILLPKFLVS